MGKKIAQGRDAVDRLGARLDTAAKRVGMSSARLRKTLLEDRYARVDECGALFYEEPVVPAPQGGLGAAPLPEAAVLPYLSTFKLHSRPGSLRTIYLDFDGFRLEGSAWNYANNNGVPWDLVPYDIDGNPASFSNTEQDIIQDVWRRVSEDYAPFDIDVTTEDPGFDAIDRSSPEDPRYGTRAVITNDSVVGSTCNCGGLAYVGVFDALISDSWYHSFYQPAVMFANNLSGGTSSKSIAEATSHEVGHNLGLNHDGTATESYYQGAGAWAPLMGVGYSRPLSQFSKGEYTGANNTEDDFSIIAANGGTPVADDHSDVRTSATPLGALPAGVEAEISTAADVDWFSFTSTGTSVTVAAAPAVLAPNLDIKISLYDSVGAIVTSADPPSAFVNADSASGLAASLTATTVAGSTYFVQVDGVGAGNVATDGYSDYGSVGRYSLSVATNSAPVITTASLPSTVVGQSYSQILTSAGGNGTKTWSMVSGSLPAGLALASTGTISGIPTSTSTSTFTLRVTDGNSQSSTRTFTVTPGVKVTSQNLPEASTGIAYSATLTGTGGTAPYTWLITSGSLPAGLSLSGGVIAGTPSNSGTAVFTVQMTDSASRTTSRVITLTVAAPLTVSNQTMNSGVVGAQYTGFLYASDGRPSYIWTLASGSVPPGTTLTSSGWVTGTPSTAGTFIFTIRATDRSGRTATATATLLISPPAPTLTSLAPSSGSTLGGTSVTITGTNLSGASGVSFGGTAATSFSVVNSTTVTAVSPAHAAGQVDVIVTTPGGTTATGAGSKFTYVVSAPTLTSLSPSSGSTLGGTSVTITGTNLSGASAVTFGGTAATGVTVVNSTTVIAVSPARAAGQVDVTVTTPGGTTATGAGSKFTYVVSAPTLTSLSPSSGSTLGGTSVTITGTNLTGASGVSFGGTAATSFSVVNSTTVTAVSPARAAGQVDVTVTTPGGSTSVSANSKFTFVTPAPTLTSLTPTSGSTLGGTAVTVTGTNLTGASGVSFGGTAATSFSVVDSTTVTAVSPAHAAGQVDVTVTTPGGTTATGANSKFTFVTPAPTLTNLTPTSGSTLGGTAVTVTGTNLTGATGVSFGGTAATSFSVVNSTTVTAVSPAHVSGQVDVVVTTPGGTTAPGAGSKFTYVVSAPTLTGLSPSSGSTLGGTSVTITGTGLDDASAVTFGGTAATSFSVVDATTVTAVSPAHVAGQVDVAVTTPGGTTSVSANSKFTFVTPAPTLTNLTPTSGSTLGGTAVTITGTNLTGASGVSFGGTAATSFSVVNSTTVTAISPAHVAGQVDVAVTTPGGTTSVSANSKFTFVTPAPTLTSLTPTSGSTLGGTAVTVTGTNLTGASAVTFGGTAATSFSVVDSTTVTAVSPAHVAGQVDVVVTTPGGSTATGAGSKFSYVVSAPTLTGLTPTSGSTLGGTSVTISGTNLTGASGVSFGGTAATSFSVVDSTTVTAVSPAHVAGQVDVAVTTPGGTTSVSANSKFTFVTPAPTLTGLTPTSGSTLGGTAVTVTGTNLTGASGVSFGGTAATSFSVVDSTTVTAVSPAHVAGQVDVAVTTPGGTTSVSANSKFTFVTPAPGALTGTVTAASDPLRGAQVRVYATTGVSPVAAAVSAADGTWSVSLPTGTYEVQVVPPSGRHVRAWVGGATRASATDFAVTSGPTSTGTTSLLVR